MTFTSLGKKFEDTKSRSVGKPRTRMRLRFEYSEIATETRAETPDQSAS